MSFGHALYYPYINMTNKNWIKAALLYWNKISRIVPKRVQPSDSEEIIRLNEEFNFLQNLSPRNWEVSQAFRQFSRNLEKYTHQHLSRIAFLRRHPNFSPANYRRWIEMYHDDPDFLMDDPRFRRFLHEFNEDLDFRHFILRSHIQREGSYIHVEKLDEHLKYELYSLGLAIPDENRYSDWIRIDNEIGHAYMTYLAKTISINKGLPIITDVEGFFAESILFEGDIDRNDNRNPENLAEYELASMLIDYYLPEDINTISIDKVIKYRMKYERERIAFFNHIKDSARDISYASSTNELMDAVKHAFESQVDKTEKLQKGYNELGISFIKRCLVVSIPIAFGLSESAGNFGAAAIGGGVGLIAAHEKVRKERDELQNNPLSYLLSIQSEFGNKNLAERLGDRFKGFRKNW